MSSKFNHFAPQKTMQHFLKSTQYTFKHCSKKYEYFKRGKNEVVFHARLSNLCNQMVRQMTILTDFGNLHISLK